MIELLIFIHPEAGNDGQQLKMKVETTFPGFTPTVLQSIPALKNHLMQPCPYEKLEVFVLLADTLPRLFELNALNEWFEGKRLILILPDSDSRTLAAGHRLRPRFISFKQESYEYVCSVIGRMIQNADSVVQGPQPERRRNKWRQSN